jgi:EmrB/QacA subfamily drug resistance transporter
MSWVLNAYTVVYAALLVPAGRLADLRGRKTIFVAGVAIFIAASAACGAASSVGVLIAARAVQAIGGALLLPASLSLVLAAFPAAKRAVVVALWGAVSGLAAAFGPSLGTLLVEHLGWQSAFFINVPIGGIALYRAIVTLDESRNPDAGAPLDVVGVLLLIVGVGAIAFGLVRSEAAGWTSSVVVAALAVGAGTLASFVAWARRVPAPAIDISLFEHRTYRFVNLATLTFGVAFAMMFFSVFQFLTGVWGYSLSHAGIASAPGPLLVIPTSIVCGRIASRAGHRPLLVGGAFLFAAGAVWTSIVPTAEPAYLTTWFPGIVLTGIGVGMVLPSLSAAAVAELPPSRFGIGSAVNQAVRQIGSVLGVALAIVLVGRAPTLLHFEAVFRWQAALAIVTALFALFVDTRPRAT